MIHATAEAEFMSPEEERFCSDSDQVEHALVLWSGPLYFTPDEDSETNLQAGKRQQVTIAETYYLQAELCKLLPRASRGADIQKNHHRPKDAEGVIALIVQKDDVDCLKSQLETHGRSLIRLESPEFEFHGRHIDVIDDPATIYSFITRTTINHFCDEGQDRFQLEESESCADYLSRLSAPLPEIIAELDFVAACGHDLSLRQHITEKRTRRQEAICFLVDGLVPARCVTLLAGARKSGKSTALTELACTVSQGGGNWCGFTVGADLSQGLVLLFGGEDPQEIINERDSRILEGHQSERLVVHGNEVGDLITALDRYRGAQVSLIVVDPIRKYYSGDEDGSDAPNTLFNVLEAAAAHHGCPVIVSHHLRKDSKPTTVHEATQSVRGSGLFLDRPRVIIGMARKGTQVEIGIGKDATGSPMHNLPSDLMFEDARQLVRDDKTHRLTPNKGSVPQAEQDAGSVLGAARSLIESGARVTKSGKRGLFENWPAGFAPIPRARVHAACGLLLRDGRLVGTGDGIELPRGT